MNRSDHVYRRSVCVCVCVGGRGSRVRTILSCCSTSLRVVPRILSLSCNIRPSMQIIFAWFHNDFHDFLNPLAPFRHSYSKHCFVSFSPSSSSYSSSLLNWHNAVSNTGRVEVNVPVNLIFNDADRFYDYDFMMLIVYCL